MSVIKEYILNQGRFIEMHFSAIISLTFGLAGIVPAVLAFPYHSGCNSPSQCGRVSLGCDTLCPSGVECFLHEDCISNICKDQKCVDVENSRSKLRLMKRASYKKTSVKHASSKKTPIKRPVQYCIIPTPTQDPTTTASTSVPTLTGNRWQASDFLQASLSKLNIMQDSGPIIGGTGFYAQPIDLSAAKTTMFQYDIYFQPGFDFVKGGKLPGIYGGHSGCSGGRNSQDCFSSRFMFRTGGAGESYIYLPFDQQVPGFCKIPPKSVCNPDYGTSIGRGSWTFPTGEWVTVSQTITLNTVGVADGSITRWIPWN
ncbi:hypothetical protein BDEG_28237 [Batrachochytrium dendrobatidis JEL423]|uniref:Polysaccharide lyase 14 domain-containing protein n=1 Tax=Batrachochytrium dendrobatidis (strain JEL423) TaxID=403673 RepID=A0A177X080_BATDL|nr:hypothetical protein BDEG_28237 [Batrachochytrium dendrobatidis JEL423]